MRRCIFHIGHPKTATTYLQHCLHLNTDLFAQHNYWLPGDFSALGFYDLVPLSQQGAVISGNLAPLHALMCDGPGTMVPAMHDLLFAAPGMPPDCDVLLSSELFFYYVNALVRVIRTAENYGLVPEVIAYLPRQDRAAITGYLQNVRYHGFSQGVIDFLVHDNNMPYCHYLSVFSRLRAALPELCITLRSFDRAFLRDGDVMTDFLAAIGCRVDPAACLRPARQSNEGISLEQYESLRAANILGREDAAALLRRADVTLTRNDRDRITAYTYRPGVHAFLADHYLPDNQALLDRFMPEANAAERAFWLRFDPPPAPVGLDEAAMVRLRKMAFAT